MNLYVTAYNGLMSVGERIRQARKAQRLSQQALGEAVGAVQSAVGAWERNEAHPRRDTMVKIAEYLGVTRAWIEFGDAIASKTPPPPVSPEALGALKHAETALQRGYELADTETIREAVIALIETLPAAGMGDLSTLTGVEDEKAIAEIAVQAACTAFHIEDTEARSHVVRGVVNREIDRFWRTRSGI